VDFCVDHEIIGKSPVISYGEETETKQQLVFDVSFMEQFVKKEVAPVPPVTPETPEK
jgi:hypothetical protein